MTKAKDTVMIENRAAEDEPKLVVRLGRGRTGGTTGLDWQIQRARAAGRDPIIADSARNPSLSGLYPGVALVPPSGSVAAFKRWLDDEVLNRAAEERRSVALDVGGGQDGSLSDYMQDMDLLRFCRAVGLLPVANFYLGPDMADLDHALAIKREGFFAPKQTLLVMNEGVLKRGETPAGAFEAIKAHPEFLAWIGEGARVIYMRTLPALEEVRRLGLTLNAAARNEPGEGGARPGLSRAHQVRFWMEDMEEEVAQVKATSWLL